MNHLLPDAMSDLEETTSYPLAFTLALVCYMFVLGLEKVFLGQSGEHMHSHGHGHGHEHEHEHGHGHGQAKAHSGSENAKVYGGTSVRSNGTESDRSSESPLLMPPKDLLPSTSGDDFVQSVAIVADIGIEGEQPKSSAEADEHSHSHDVMKSYGAYLLMLFLSLHSVFEGIALGIQNDTHNILTLFIGIILHKWAEGVSLATAFIKSRKDRTRALGLMFIFALASPVGISIGMGVASYDSPEATGTFTALAAGTFLYVACNEIIAHEFDDSTQRPLRYVALAAGVGLICLVTALNPED